jgi:hypothetical protein
MPRETETVDDDDVRQSQRTLLRHSGVEEKIQRRPRKRRV